MNKEQFTLFLENTGKLDTGSIDSLVGLINEFPYCQPARVLLTLNLLKEKNVRYDAELKTTAVYVSNRGLLRKYIDKIITEEVSKTANIHKATKKTNVKPDNKKAEVVDNSNTDTSDPSLKNKNAAPDVDQYDTETINEVKNIINRHIQELEDENELRKKASKVSDKKNKGGKKKNEIIDEFIKKEPSISRPKSSFYNPTEKARESIVDTEGIVSETLAGIYYDQGHLRKAIKIYQKLSLKFPEKSSYFAALINKAEKELNLK